MSQPAERSLVAFLRAMAILALNAPDQVTWLNSLGLPGTAALADELALEFDDGYLLVPSFIEGGWLSSGVQEFLAPIEAALTSMSESGDGDVWTIEALKTDHRWEEVRVLARAALIHLK